MEFKKYDFESLNYSAEENLLSYLKEHEELYERVLEKILVERRVFIEEFNNCITYKQVLSMDGVVMQSLETDVFNREYRTEEEWKEFFSRKRLTSFEFEKLLLRKKDYCLPEDMDSEKLFYTVLKYLNLIDSNFAVSLRKKVVELSIAECENRKADLVVELGILQEKKYEVKPYRIKPCFKSLNHSAEENLLSYLKEHEELYESVLEKTLVEYVIIKESDDFIRYKRVLSMNGVVIQSLEKESGYESDLWRKEDLEEIFSSKRCTSSEFEELLLRKKDYCLPEDMDSEKLFYTVLEYLNLIDSNFAVSLHKKVVEQSIVECERKIADLVVKLRGLQKVSDTENGHPGKQGAMKVIVKRRKRLS